MSQAIPTSPAELRDLADQHLRLSRRYTDQYLARDLSEHTLGQLYRLQTAHYEVAMQLRTIAAALEG